MKGRETKGAPSADLLVCFPSRAHLTLMPKPICSPARPSEPSKRHHHHHLKKSSTRAGRGNQASPLLWAKNKQMDTEIAEPTSPKVTCAGQIKVRHKATSCKSWQSVMEEIERIHNNRKRKKRSNWVESFGFKKDIMQFLTCLRSIRFDFRCFGSFPQADVTTGDDDEEEDHEYEQYHQENHVGMNDSDEASRTIFSKWFMVLQDNQNSTGYYKGERTEQGRPCGDDDGGGGGGAAAAAPPVPPPNALLLMRCRSAPANSWLEEKKDEEQAEEDDRNKEEEKKGNTLKTLIEEEKRNSSMVMMRYDTDFYKISSDIAKETWVLGGMRDPLSRSRSWKR